MDNRRWAALALIVIGLAAVNFFYLSDLVLLQAPQDQGAQVIVVGWKSAIAIGFANVLTLHGVWLVARNGPGR